MSGYLKAVSTRQQYCDYDCYLRYEARNMPTPWLTASYEVPFELMTSFAAASCCYSIALARVALQVGRLVMAEISSDRPRQT